jgi:hypothetical protein
MYLLFLYRERRFSEKRLYAHFKLLALTSTQLSKKIGENYAK